MARTGTGRVENLNRFNCHDKNIYVGVFRYRHITQIRHKIIFIWNIFSGLLQPIRVSACLLGLVWPAKLVIDLQSWFQSEYLRRILCLNTCHGRFSINLNNLSPNTNNEYISLTSYIQYGLWTWTCYDILSSQNDYTRVWHKYQT